MLLICSIHRSKLFQNYFELYTDNVCKISFSSHTTKLNIHFVKQCSAKPLNPWIFLYVASKLTYSRGEGSREKRALFQTQNAGILSAQGKKVFSENWNSKTSRLRLHIYFCRTLCVFPYKYFRKGNFSGKLPFKSNFSK